jgi:hypothetical protein
MRHELYITLCIACFLTGWAWLFNIDRNRFTADMMLAIMLVLALASVAWWLVDPNI